MKGETVFPYTHGDYLEVRQKRMQEERYNEMLEHSKALQDRENSKQSSHRKQKTQSEFSVAASPSNVKPDDMRQEALRSHFMKESPFFARKHVNVQTRGLNEGPKQRALHDARQRFEKHLMASKFADMETSKMQRDTLAERDRFDEAQKQSKKEECKNLRAILD